MTSSKVIETELQDLDNSSNNEELNKVVEYFEYEVKGDSETLWDELAEAFPELGDHEINMIIKDNPHWKNKSGYLLKIPKL